MQTPPGQRLSRAGVGKSHLAIATGRDAVRQGCSVLFATEQSAMVALVKAHSEGRLEERRLIGSGSLIPPERSYRRHLKLYERQVRAASMDRMHGLRHELRIAPIRGSDGLEGAGRGWPGARRSERGARRG